MVAGRGDEPIRPSASTTSMARGGVDSRPRRLADGLAWLMVGNQLLEAEGRAIMRLGGHEFHDEAPTCLRSCRELGNPECSGHSPGHEETREDARTADGAICRFVCLFVVDCTQAPLHLGCSME